MIVAVGDHAGATVVKFRPADQVRSVAFQRTAQIAEGDLAPTDNNLRVLPACWPANSNPTNAADAEFLDHDERTMWLAKPR
jgi:hypothetical protein